MDEIGDLGFHTNKAIKKHVVWKTDSLGYRNESVCHNPDILFIGDSFLAGCTLSQDDMLPSQVKKMLDNSLNVYSLAPASFSNFLRLNKQGILKKPKMIIIIGVERFFCEKNDTVLSNNDFQEWKYFDKIDECIDRNKKGASRQWFASIFKSRTGIGIPSLIINKMLFYEGAKSIENDSSNFYQCISNMKMINEKCKQMGIQFLFVPMPNKESVYWELVPYKKQPNLLFRIDSALRKQNIAVINTLALYNEERRKGNWLYHFDDTHWNENGVTAVAKEIVKFIEKKPVSVTISASTMFAK